MKRRGQRIGPAVVIETAERKVEEELRREMERETMSKRLHKSMALEERGSKGTLERKKADIKRKQRSKVNRPHRTPKHSTAASLEFNQCFVDGRSLSLSLSFLPVVVTDSELIGKRTMQLWGRRDGITQIINHWANIHCTMLKCMLHTHTHTHASTHSHTHKYTDNDHQWISG